MKSEEIAAANAYFLFYLQRRQQERQILPNAVDNYQLSIKPTYACQDTAAPLPCNYLR